MRDRLRPRHRPACLGVLGACAVLHLEQTALLSMVVVTASLLLFFLGYEHGRPRLRDTMPVAVLAALAAAGRILFAPAKKKCRGQESACMLAFRVHVFVKTRPTEQKETVRSP